MTYFGSAYASSASGVFTMRASPLGGLWSINDRTAVYDATSGYVYIGYTSSAGAVTILTWNPATQSAVSTVTLATGLELHAAPCILIRNDGYILVGWSAHDGTEIKIARSSAANDASAFDAADTITAAEVDGYADMTYIYLHQLPNEANRIWLFWREIGPTPLSTGRLARTYSDDGGATWNAHRTVILESAATPEVIYWKSVDDGAGKIHFFHTDTARTDANPSSLYHRYYDETDGLLHKSDGTTVSSLTPSTSTLIHDDSLGPISPTAVGVEAGGAPYVAYNIYRSATPSSDYYIARYRTGAWQNDLVVNNGGLASGHRTLGQLAVSASDPDLAIGLVKSGTYHEAFLYTSADDGATWDDTQLTTGSSSYALGVQAILDAPATLEFVWARGTWTTDANYTVGMEGYGA